MGGASGWRGGAILRRRPRRGGEHRRRLQRPYLDLYSPCTLNDGLVRQEEEGKDPRARPAHRLRSRALARRPRVPLARPRPVVRLAGALARTERSALVPHRPQLRAPESGRRRLLEPEPLCPPRRATAAVLAAPRKTRPRSPARRTRRRKGERVLVRSRQRQERPGSSRRTLRRRPAPGRRPVSLHRRTRRRQPVRPLRPVGLEQWRRRVWLGSPARARV